MIKWQSSLLRRIVGRVKEMAVWWTAFGAMLIPLAFIELYVFLIIGFLSMAMGWTYTWREMKQNRRERQLFGELLLSIQSILSDILKELRGDKYDRKNNSE